MSFILLKNKYSPTTNQIQFCVKACCLRELITLIQLLSYNSKKDVRWLAKYEWKTPTIGDVERTHEKINSFSNTVSLIISSKNISSLSGRVMFCPNISNMSILVFALKKELSNVCYNIFLHRKYRVTYVVFIWIFFKLPKKFII